MIVCHKHKFIFIKTRKTAGTSIELGLSQFCGPNDIIMRLANRDEELRRELGYKQPRNYRAPFRSYKFSDWKELFFKGRFKPIDGRHSPANFIKELVGGNVWDTYFKFCFERNPFDRAVSRYYWKTHHHGRRPDINEYIQSNTQTQLSNWNKYTIDDKIVVEFVGQYENLEQDILEIIKRIGIPIFKLPRIKDLGIKRAHYSKLLNAATRTHIEGMCAKEIQAFGYTWSDSE